ncbi:hypothetical protein AtubIFM55763_003797 [Aspergillus tubingensis]|nr:hypothetical protein AtubIFM55763_003797 [Aspergillus tubingensis]
MPPFPVASEIQFKETIKHFGDLDIVVNHASVKGASMPLSELEETDWGEVIDTNPPSVAYCLKWETATDDQARFRSFIIKVSSNAILRTRPALPAGCVSSHIVTALATTVAKENDCNLIKLQMQIGKEVLPNGALQTS